MGLAEMEGGMDFAGRLTISLWVATVCVWLLPVLGCLNDKIWGNKIVDDILKFLWSISCVLFGVFGVGRFLIWLIGGR